MPGFLYGLFRFPVAEPEKVTILYTVFSFIFGLVFGSFLNVLIYRLPRSVSIIRPNSFCPHCRKPIRWYENIPLLSYVFLGGKCAHCRKPISWQYPLVELLTGLAFLFLYHQYGFSLALIFYLVFICSLIVISGIDFTHQIIPSIISLPGILLGLVFQILYGNFWLGLIGAFFGGGLILLIRVLGGWAYKKEVMGMGDVFLTAMIGAFIAFPRIIIAVFIGAIAGSLFGIVYLLVTKKHRESPIPFGPFLSLGGLVMALFGDRVILFLRMLGVYI